MILFNLDGTPTRSHNNKINNNLNFYQLRNVIVKLIMIQPMLLSIYRW